jgi:arylsulfatase A-like enzyme
MDWNFGRILSALDSSKYKNNTIVCVFADNGFHLGEKKHFGKYALWEQTTHILHMWRVPGVTKAGSICEEPVNLLDLYPTLVELCDLPKPASQLDGRSIVKLLIDPKAPWGFPSITTHKPGNQAVRDRVYRYIRYSDGQEELYNELKDPNEWSNLANDPDMQPILSGFRSQIRKDFVPPTPSRKDGSE